MSEHDEAVAFQKDLLEAEEWQKGVTGLHAHRLASMWYDDRPQDTKDGKMVIDVQYNDGYIERTLPDGTKVAFGKRLTGEELVSSYRRRT